VAAIDAMASVHSPMPWPAMKKSLAVRVWRVAHMPIAATMMN
jgi:hypothetical protein